MRPEFDGLSFAAGMALGAIAVVALLGVALFVWLFAHWREERQKLASTHTLWESMQSKVEQLRGEIETLENRRQALGLKTPPRLEPIHSMKRDIRG